METYSNDTYLQKVSSPSSTNIVKAERQNQACLKFCPRCLLYYTKIVKTEDRVSNLFVIFAVVHPILYKDSKYLESCLNYPLKPSPLSVWDFMADLL
jgi:hypothetical protein